MKNLKPLFCTLLFTAFVSSSIANSIFISPHGTDSNDGTLEQPLKSLSVAFEKLEGDTIYLLDGEYYDALQLDKVQRSAKKPLVIMPYQAAVVTFTGLEAISSEWTKYKGNIYKTKLSAPIWQLFNGTTMYMPARWPNAFLHDGSVWEREVAWSHADAKKSNKGNFEKGIDGIEIDDPEGHDLSSLDFSIKGALAVLNIGSFKTWARPVTKHESGDTCFSFAPYKGSFKPKHHYYYIEGKLELLDAPGEWFIDPETNELYVWMLQGDKLSDLKGKTQSYTFEIEKSNGVKIMGFNFVGTTLRASDSENITIEDCNFDYPSCSKRALGLTESALATKITGRTNGKAYLLSENVVRNCEFTNAESEAIYMDGKRDTVDNCYFYKIDWIVTDRPVLMNSIYVLGHHNVFRRNTIDLCGASSTVKPDKTPIIELNDIQRTGYCQTDGSLVQITIDGAPASQVRYNWFHNTIKSGARFDAPIPPTRWSNSGLMHHNVCWGMNQGLMIKGERHLVFNNTAFDNEKTDLVFLDDIDVGGGGNKGTYFANNLGGKISGNRSKPKPIPGILATNRNGLDGIDVKADLVDPENFDFRPKNTKDVVDAGTHFEQYLGEIVGDTPDIGAYEYGAKNYWIPGRKFAKASRPIPSDKSVSKNTKVELMWLGAYKADKHEVYFSSSKNEVVEATKTSKAYQGEFQDNIVEISKAKPQGTYYWRVDAYVDGNLLPGDVWEFSF